jgi:hypothetical protein
MVVPVCIAFVAKSAQGSVGRCHAGIGEYFAFQPRLHQALGYRVPMAVWREGAPPDQKQQQTEPFAA